MQANQQKATTSAKLPQLPQTTVNDQPATTGKRASKPVLVVTDSLNVQKVAQTFVLAWFEASDTMDRTRKELLTDVVEQLNGDQASAFLTHLTQSLDDVTRSSIKALFDASAVGGKQKVLDILRTKGLTMNDVYIRCRAVRDLYKVPEDKITGEQKEALVKEVVKDTKKAPREFATVLRQRIEEVAPKEAKQARKMVHMKDDVFAKRLADVPRFTKPQAERMRAACEAHLKDIADKDAAKK